MMIEARWPNTTLDVSHPIVATTSAGSFKDGGSGLSTGTITDPNLPSRPAGYWNGTTIHISPFNVTYAQGAGWTWQTGTVLSSAAGQLSFTFSKWQDAITPGPKDPYYLTGKLSELDAGGEWFLDSATQTLYFWTPASDSPAQHVVEAKHRQFAFDLSGRSFITIQGFNLFAGTITSNAQSQYLVLDGLSAQYLSHYSLIPGTKPAQVHAYDSGVILYGQNNVLRNSTIAFSAANGVTVVGGGHRVFNNVVHDVDYTPTYATTVNVVNNTPAKGNIIAWNTLYNTGRDGLEHTYANSGTGKILHNDISNYGLQTNDLGCTYTGGTDGKGSEIAYNLCHDTPARLSNGIYLDNGTSNFVVHHNVDWNILHGSMVLNAPSTNNKIYNNTFAGAPFGLASFNVAGPGQFPGTEIKNNIFTAGMSYSPANPSLAPVMQNNILQGTDPQFVDPAHGNFQLKPASPAIGAGVVLSPYTDGYTGKAPDIGAYDHGLPPWRAGGRQPIATVFSAASYGTAQAPESIVFAFGSRLATDPGDPPTGTFPTSLAGSTVTITDGTGVDSLAPLFYVRPNQVAFQIPAGTAPGVALITVTAGDSTISLGSAPVFPTAPGLFSANANGSGVALGELVRMTADGTQSVEAIFQFDSDLNQYVPLPIDPGPGTDQLTLVLYGSGIRHHEDSSTSVEAQVGGVSAQVLYAGTQSMSPNPDQYNLSPPFPGVDEVDIAMPNTLTAGEADVVVNVDGQPSNTVTIAMAPMAASGMRSQRKGQ